MNFVPHFTRQISKLGFSILGRNSSCSLVIHGVQAMKKKKCSTTTPLITRYSQTYQRSPNATMCLLRARVNGSNLRTEITGLLRRLALQTRTHFYYGFSPQQ